MQKYGRIRTKGNWIILYFIIKNVANGKSQGKITGNEIGMDRVFLLKYFPWTWSRWLVFTDLHVASWLFGTACSCLCQSCLSDALSLKRDGKPRENNEIKIFNPHYFTHSYFFKNIRISLVNKTILFNPKHQFRKNLISHRYTLKLPTLLMKISLSIKQIFGPNIYTYLKININSINKALNTF